MTEIEKAESLSNALNSFNLKTKISKGKAWSVNNKYGRPLFLQFNFIGKEKGDNIYKYLKSEIELFKGEVEWTVYSNDVFSSYIIVPEKFIVISPNADPFTADFFKKTMGKKGFIEFMDKAFLDVPILSDYIMKILDKYQS